MQDLIDAVAEILTLAGERESVPNSFSTWTVGYWLLPRPREETVEVNHWDGADWHHLDSGGRAQHAATLTHYTRLLEDGGFVVTPQTEGDRRPVLLVRRPPAHVDALPPLLIDPAPRYTATDSLPDVSAYKAGAGRGGYGAPLPFSPEFSRYLIAGWDHTSSIADAGPRGSQDV